MRSILVALLPVPLFLAMTTNAQEEPKKERKLNDEIGLDVTYFVKQFLAPSSGGPVSANPYYLTYRHLFKKLNVRVGVGATHWSDGGTSLYPESPWYNKTHTTIAARLGIEQPLRLSDRWQMFYGVDVVYGWTHDNEDPSSWNASFYTGWDLEEESFGPSAVAGIRYYVSPRLSLLTEAAWTYLVKNSTESLSYTSLDGTEMPPDIKATTRETRTDFRLPLFLVVAVTL